MLTDKETLQRRAEKESKDLCASFFFFSVGFPHPTVSILKAVGDDDELCLLLHFILINFVCTLEL